MIVVNANKGRTKGKKETGRRLGAEQAVQATGPGGAGGGMLLNALLELGRHGDPEDRLAACLALENLAAGSPAASKALLAAGAHVMVSSRPRQSHHASEENVEAFCCYLQAWCVVCRGPACISGKNESSELLSEFHSWAAFARSAALPRASLYMLQKLCCTKPALPHDCSVDQAALHLNDTMAVMSRVWRGNSAREHPCPGGASNMHSSKGLFSLQELSNDWHAI